jgi:hypothetical protein
VAVATRIRIVLCPPGEAPLSVRLAWVGLELSLASGRTSRQLAMTSGVVSAPRGLWRRLAALFLGDYGVQTGYMVTARDAVNVLQTKDPAAAAWWREHCGLLDGKRPFLFPRRPARSGPRSYLSAVRSAAGPPLTAMRTPVSFSVVPSRLNTWMSFSTMLPTKTRLPSGENAAPCDQ